MNGSNSFAGERLKGALSCRKEIFASYFNVLAKLSNFFSDTLVKTH